MIKFISIFSLVFILACNTTTTPEVKTESDTPATLATNQIPVVDYDGLAPIFAYFLDLHKKYKDQKYKFIFVSLDFPKQIDKKLKPFLEKNPLPGDVIVLDDSDSNRWIPEVDPEWSGAIPATVIYNSNRKIFAEKSFHDFPELDEWVETLK